MEFPMNFDLFVALVGVATFAVIGGHTYYIHRKAKKESMFERTLRQ